MTAANLIKLLQSFPGEARVIVPNGEYGGYDDVEGSELVPIVVNKNAVLQSYAGAHDDPGPGEKPDEMAVVIL